MVFREENKKPLANQSFLALGIHKSATFTRQMENYFTSESPTKIYFASYMSLVI